MKGGPQAEARVLGVFGVAMINIVAIASLREFDAFVRRQTAPFRAARSLC